MGEIQSITNTVNVNAAFNAELSRILSPPTVPGDNSEAQSNALEVYNLQNNFRLQFSVDEATGKTVIRVINAETQQVIRTIPPEEILKAVAKLQQMFENIVNVMV